MKPYARLAAFGALAASLGLFGLFLLVAFGARATTLGGMDATQAWLTWISLAVPFSAIIAAHLVYAGILRRYAQER